MQISKSRLKQIVKEELLRIDEGMFDSFNKEPASFEAMSDLLNHLQQLANSMPKSEIKTNLIEGVGAAVGMLSELQEQYESY
jgi:hypothetical protein